MTGHSVTSTRTISGRVVGTFAEYHESRIGRSCIGFDVSEVRPAPVGHIVGVGIDLGDVGSAREHLSKHGFGGLEEVSVCGLDAALADGDEARIVLLARPEQNLPNVLFHGDVILSVGGFIPTVTDAGAESIRSGRGAA